MNVFTSLVLASLAGSIPQLFEQGCPRRVKPLLYIYRVLLTSIHLMNTGEVEANLVTLNETGFHLRHVDELVARKRAGASRAPWRTTMSPSTKGSFTASWLNSKPLPSAARCPNCPPGVPL